MFKRKAVSGFMVLSLLTLSLLLVHTGGDVKAAELSSNSICGSGFSGYDSFIGRVGTDGGTPIANVYVELRGVLNDGSQVMLENDLTDANGCWQLYYEQFARLNGYVIKLYPSFLPTGYTGYTVYEDDPIAIVLSPSEVYFPIKGTGAAYYSIDKTTFVAYYP